MARKYFGTDGVRGIANQGAMAPDTVLKLGLAAGSLYSRGSHRHRAVIGKDTRLSGYMIAASHNPYHDNGIKLFGPDGYKLSDEQEAAIESAVDNASGVKLAAPE